MSKAAPAHLDTDVLVVGGGISGCATSYYLARAGHSVVLAEVHDLNTAGSGRNAGSLHGQLQFEPYRTNGLQWSVDYLPALRFLNDSLAIWRTLSEELGTDLEVSTKGGLLVADTDEDASRVAEKVSLEAAHGFPAELVTGRALRSLVPYLSSAMVAAEYCASEGKANPLLAAPAFGRAALHYGARILTGTRVLTVGERAGGFEVATSGPAVRCAKVVLAAGGHIPGLAAQLGISLPITDEPVQVHATEPMAPVISHLVYYAGGRLTLKQARSGTLLIGGGWPASVDAATGYPIVSTASMRQNLGVAAHVAPWIGSVRVIRAWAGIGNATPDLRPLIGEIPAVPGAFVGMFPHMGLTAGPLMGQVLAALVEGRDPGRELHSFALDRFRLAPLG
jgi:glycine/D-amino acid oxidase-like deaminating enzyme